MEKTRLQLPTRFALGALFVVGGLLVAMIVWALWQNYLLSGKEAARKEHLRQELNEIVRKSMSRF